MLGTHKIVSLASGGMADHTCALTDDGTVLCWGRNDSSQVGAPPNPDGFLATPTQVGFLP
jgi:alpha-tubulin suppressor-like RCC1 family protein